MEEIIYVYNQLQPKIMSIITASCDVYVFQSLLSVMLHRIKALLSKKNNYQRFINTVPDNRIQGDIEKICLLTGESAIRENSSISKIFTVHILSNGRIELLAKRANKYEALCLLERSGKIILRDLLFMGDDYNDIECFANLENTIAMGNATDDIKRMAKYTTEDNDHDGVGVALKKYL